MLKRTRLLIMRNSDEEKMTIDPERFRAINNTRDFLLRLAKEKPMKVSELRSWAWRLLKHYPEDYWVRNVSKDWFSDKKQ